ncbi:MAG: hypothetical protein NC822_03245 [Candidatus Omnitrophica bacterium]|nr:hypothetical protein [Candidatus Omnitrophota bacterium]MCM8826153.1 hypothetical protein [Candidatus Omnitrophota bacterium]
MNKKGNKKYKESVYVCFVCGKEKKLKTKVKCCGKYMTAKEKGSWNI